MNRDFCANCKDSQYGTNGQVYLEDVKSAVNLALVQQSWDPRFGGDGIGCTRIRP